MEAFDVHYTSELFKKFRMHIFAFTFLWCYQTGARAVVLKFKFPAKNDLLVLRSTNQMTKMVISGLIYHLDIAFDMLNSLKAELGSGVKYERAVHR